MESPADSMMFREMDDVRGPTRRVEESIRPSTAPVGGRSQVGNPATMMDAKNTFYNAMNNKTRTMQNTSRFSATKHNPLRGSDRKTSMESMRLAKIGLDGLHRHDLKPASDKEQHPIRGYYLTDLRQKMGTTKPQLSGLGGKSINQPLFTVKGLQNISSLPTGDPRVTRTMSIYRETYVDPAKRAASCSHFDHVQDGEPVHDDNDLGPVNILSTKGGALGRAEEDLVAARRRYYREAVEGMDVQRVDAAEKELQDKLRESAFGPPLAGFHMRSVFRFFDRDARGAVDLKSFTGGLERLGLIYPFEPHIVAALFARYDTTMRGYIDLYQIIEELLGEDYVNSNAKSQMVGQLQGAISTMRATGNRDFTKVLGVVHHHHHHDDDDDDQQVDVHELSDQEFLHRQRVRRVFRTVDRDNSGRIERSELDHLLVMLGLRVAPYEMRAIFDYVDSDNSGTIEFDEFYEWYTKKPKHADVDLVHMRQQRAVRATQKRFH